VCDILISNLSHVTLPGMLPLYMLLCWLPTHNLWLGQVSSHFFLPWVFITSMGISALTTCTILLLTHWHHQAVSSTDDFNTLHCKVSACKHVDFHGHGPHLVLGKACRQAQKCLSEAPQSDWQMLGWITTSMSLNNIPMLLNLAQQMWDVELETAVGQQSRLGLSTSDRHSIYSPQWSCS
jgi:hypothetical protein